MIDTVEVDARLMSNADLIAKLEDACEKRYALTVTLPSGRKMIMIPLNEHGDPIISCVR